MSELAAQVPNFTIVSGGSGAGGQLTLRGIGSTAISAAFESAIAFNIDGVTVSDMRLVQNSFMDLGQIEVLKGPQSLYFGKSSSAGVISMQSQNPTDELSAGLRLSRELEDEGWLLGGHVSGPLAHSLGGRLALQYKRNANFWDVSPQGPVDPAVEITNPERGESSFDARATLQWDAIDDLDLNLKVAFSNYRNDGANQNNDVQCVDPGRPQTTYYPAIPGLGRSWPSGYDCDTFDGEHPMGDVHPLLGRGLDTRVPFVDSKIVLTRLLGNYRLTDSWTLTSVTGYFGLEEQGLDNYTFDANGFGTGRTENLTRSFSQELRLSGDLASFLDLTAGLYFQKQRKEFNTDQVVLGAALLPEPLGGLDADTGNGFDWTKNHGTDSLAYSAFFSLAAHLTDALELAGGVRWSHEEKENVIEVPYMHDAFESPVLRLAIPNLATEGFRTEPIEFDDQNLSPEVSLKYALTDSVNVYAAYKTGFKSGGIDNSALLTNVSDQAIRDLVFESETADGFEGGVRSTLLDQMLRLNLTAFRYEFTNLQQQTFDSASIQFATFNVGDVLQQGAELDGSWLTPVEGLSLRSVVAYTDTHFAGHFYDNFDPATGNDLEGRQLVQNSKWAGNVGFDLQRPVPATAWMGGLSFLESYRGKYFGNNTAAAFVQEGFFTTDLSISIGDPEKGWRFSVIGTNLTDEIYSLGGGGRPFSDPGDSGPIELLVPDTRPLDQLHFLNRGRTVVLEARYEF